MISKLVKCPLTFNNKGVMRLEQTKKFKDVNFLVSHIDGGPHCPPYHGL